MALGMYLYGIYCWRQQGLRAKTIKSNHCYTVEEYQQDDTPPETVINTSSGDNVTDYTVATVSSGTVISDGR